MIRSRHNTTHVCVIHTTLFNNTNTVYRTPNPLCVGQAPACTDSITYTIARASLLHSCNFFDTSRYQTGRSNYRIAFFKLPAKILKFLVCNNVNIPRGAISDIIWCNDIESATVLVQYAPPKVVYYIVDIASMFKRFDILAVALPNRTRVPKCVLQDVIIWGIDAYIDALSKSLDLDLLVILLCQAIGYNCLEYVIIILDNGKITVNDCKRHFTAAVKKKKYDIAREFVRRGVIYNNSQMIRRYAMDDPEMQAILMNYS